ncbi:hypothetical protein DERF_005537, partial [Dermatophagoides farinae]
MAYVDGWNKPTAEFNKFRYISSSAKSSEIRWWMIYDDDDNDGNTLVRRIYDEIYKI